MAEQMEGLESNGDLPGYFRYQDEESLIQILEEISAIIRTRGVKELERLSVKDEVNVYENAMHHALYLHHEELAEAFIQRTGMVSTGYDRDNLIRWFDYIDRRIEELSKGSYTAEAKREVLEIAAFLGEQIVEYKGGTWVQSFYKKWETTFIVYYQKGDGRHKTRNIINLLQMLVGKYLGNTREWLENPFYEVISTT